MRISEAATGVGEQMADVGLAMQRAVDKTENMKARADAVSGARSRRAPSTTSPQLGSGEDDIDRQLKQLSSQPAVDDELAKMKGELGGGAPTRGDAAQIASGEGAPSRRREQPGMIVRISGEGQYRPRRLESDAAQRARARPWSTRSKPGSESDFAPAFAALLDYVRAHGTRVGDDELEASDVILPPADITLRTRPRREFTGEGLIPD